MSILMLVITHVGHVLLVLIAISVILIFSNFKLVLVFATTDSILAKLTLAQY